MSRKPNAHLYTLRSGSDDLLPLVTILLYRQSRAPLDRTLASILRQTDVDVEIILLQDGQAPSLFDLLFTDWPSNVPLYILETLTPCGKSHSVNLALPHAVGDFLLVLDAGDELAEDALGTMVEELDQAEEDVIGVYGDIELWESSRAGYNIRETLLGEMSNQRLWLLARLEEQKRIAPPLVRTETMQQIGGYPTAYPSQGWLLADTAFALALLQRGKLAYLPAISMRRFEETPGVFLAEDEQRILQMLLRQAAKRMSIPPEFRLIALKRKPLG